MVSDGENSESGFELSIAVLKAIKTVVMLMCLTTSLIIMFY